MANTYLIKQGYYAEDETVLRTTDSEDIAKTVVARYNASNPTKDQWHYETVASLDDSSIEEIYVVKFVYYKDKTVELNVEKRLRFEVDFIENGFTDDLKEEWECILYFPEEAKVGEAVEQDLIDKHSKLADTYSSWVEGAISSTRGDHYSLQEVIRGHMESTVGKHIKPLDLF